MYEVEVGVDGNVVNGVLDYKNMQVKSVKCVLPWI